jgi:hypothetical protein
MARYLSPGFLAAIAATGCRPVLLVALDQRVPGLVRALRWASTSDGVNRGVFSFFGTTYDVRVARIPEFRMTLAGMGVGVLDNGTIEIVQPDEDGDPLTALLADGPFDGSYLTMSMVPWTDREQPADVLRIAGGEIRNVSWDEGTLTLSWVDGAARKHRTWPVERFTETGYPNAPTERWGTIKPVILGDLSGRAFDFTTPASGAWTHVRCPQIAGMPPRYWLADTDAAHGQEDLIVLGGIVCEIPSGSRTISGDYLEITGQEFHAWVRPAREGSGSTGVDDASYARTDDLGEYAVIEGGDILILEFPGLAETLGAYGAGASPAAADIVVYVVCASASGSATMEMTILDEGSPIAGHDAVLKTLGTTIATQSESVGDHFTALSDLATITVKLEMASGTAHVHRVIARVKFRSSDALAAWDELPVYRSQRGFIESASAASDDYQDGDYLDAPGLVPRTTPARNPADIVETVLRSKAFGLGLRASGWTNPSSELTAPAGNGTTIAITAGTAVSFPPETEVLVDAEVMRVTGHVVTIAGDATAQLSGLTIVGATAANTDAGMLYWSLEASGDDVTLSIYKDSAKTDLVADAFLEGGVSGSGTTSIDEFGSSGINGSVTIAWTIDDDDAGNTLALSGLVVQRGQAGSMATVHGSGADLYIIGTGGEVHCGSFRGAANMLRHETGADLVAGGDMEAFTSGVANGWTTYDPSSKGAFAAATGYARRYGQAIERVDPGSEDPRIGQTISTTAGSWYRFTGWVKALSGSPTCTASVLAAEWTISATAEWQFVEMWFKATASSTPISVWGPTIPGTVVWDEVSVRALAEWSWDFVQREEMESRAWLNGVLDQCRMRLVEDSRGRTHARVWWKDRPAGTSWTRDDLVVAVERHGGREELRTPIACRRTAIEDEVTGVVVRYGWDERRRIYRKSSWVSCEQESTGQVVLSYQATARINVADTSAIYPSGRWSSFDPVGFLISGTSVTIADVGYGEPDFVADGVQPGDWFWLYKLGVGSGLAQIAAVVDTDRLTLAEPIGNFNGGMSGAYSIFPYLFRAGGLVFMPVVPGGVGTEAADYLLAYNINLIDLDPLNIPGHVIPSAGDTIWRLHSDSNDGTGVRDQIYTVRAARERQAITRVATRGQVKTRLVESKLIQDDGTAAALRDHLFDYHRRRYESDVLTTIEEALVESGDVVRVVDELAPCGAITGEVVGQRFRFGEWTIQHTLREMG